MQASSVTDSINLDVDQISTGIRLAKFQHKHNDEYGEKNSIAHIDC